MSFSFFLFLPTTTARQQDDSKTGETLDHSQKEWLGVSSLLSHALSTGLCSLIIAAGGELAAASRTRNSREGCDWHSRQAESEKTASTVLASTFSQERLKSGRSRPTGVFARQPKGLCLIFVTALRLQPEYARAQGTKNPDLDPPRFEW